MQRYSKRIRMLLSLYRKRFKNAFVSNVCFCINDWDENDPRIHKDANCRYRDKRMALDVIYELIKADMLKVNGSEKMKVHFGEKPKYIRFDGNDIFVSFDSIYWIYYGTLDGESEEDETN